MLWNRFGDGKDIWDTKDAMDFEGFCLLCERLYLTRAVFWPAPLVVCFIPPQATPRVFVFLILHS